MQMTVVEIEGRADSLVQDQSSLTLDLTRVPPDPVKIILSLPEDALNTLLLILMATVEAVSASCQQEYHQRRQYCLCHFVTKLHRESDPNLLIIDCVVLFPRTAK